MRIVLTDHAEERRVKPSLEGIILAQKLEREFPGCNVSLLVRTSKEHAFVTKDDGTFVKIKDV